MNASFVLAGSALTVASLVLAAAPTTAPSADALVDTLRDSNRTLIVFAPRDGDAHLLDQRARLGPHTEGMRERHMVVIEVVGDQVLATLGATSELKTQIQGNTALADSLRKRQSVPRDAFAVHLIGKDGGTKLRRETAVNARDVFELIDSMPMRQQEMREQK